MIVNEWIALIAGRYCLVNLFVALRWEVKRSPEEIRLLNWFWLRTLLPISSSN